MIERIAPKSSSRHYKFCQQNSPKCTLDIQSLKLSLKMPLLKDLMTISFNYQIISVDSEAQIDDK